MPEWFTGAASLVAALSALYAIIQGRKKETAEADSLIIQGYKLYVTDLQGQIDDLKQEQGLLKEQIKNLQRELDIERETRIHAEAFLTQLQARLGVTNTGTLTED